MRKFYLTLALLLCTASLVQAASMQINPEAKTFKYSTTVEKERPVLDDVTKDLISAYRQNPTEANKQALRKQIAINYDNVVARKKSEIG